MFLKSVVSPLATILGEIFVDALADALVAAAAASCVESYADVDLTDAPTIERPWRISDAVMSPTRPGLLTDATMTSVCSCPLRVRPSDVVFPEDLDTYIGSKRTHREDRREEVKFHGKTNIIIVSLR